MKMRIIPSLTILACLALTACSTVREGVIVQKRFRVEEPEVYGLYEFSFRCEPSVYWVQVEGKDVKGRERIRNIILFRHDWQALRVGDHWSREKGFSPGTEGGKG
jgi:hypothetical protein